MASQWVDRSKRRGPLLPWQLRGPPPSHRAFPDSIPVLSHLEVIRETPRSIRNRRITTNETGATLPALPLRSACSPRSRERRSKSRPLLSARGRGAADHLLRSPGGLRPRRAALVEARPSLATLLPRGLLPRPFRDVVVDRSSTDRLSASAMSPIGSGRRSPLSPSPIWARDSVDTIPPIPPLGLDMVSLASGRLGTGGRDSANRKPFAGTRQGTKSRLAKPGQQPEASLAWWWGDPPCEATAGLKVV